DLSCEVPHASPAIRPRPAPILPGFVLGRLQLAAHRLCCLTAVISVERSADFRRLRGEGWWTGGARRVARIDFGCSMSGGRFAILGRSRPAGVHAMSVAASVIIKGKKEAEKSLYMTRFQLKVL
ncbi:unnamed protein product, partial [Mycena citricolor]